MCKAIIFGISLLICIGVSQQTIAKPSCNSEDYKIPCCLQVTELLAFATSSAKAAVETSAAACASVSAASSTLIASSAAVSAAAHVSLTHSVSLSYTPGSCCEISGAILSNVSSYGFALADATSQAISSSDVTAYAAAEAKASAQAAASAYTQAQSIINSQEGSNQGSCCLFVEEALSMVQITGKFVAEASAAADAVSQLSTSAKAVADACSKAQVQASAQSSSILKASIDNCCDETFLRSRASDIATSYDSVVTVNKKLEKSIASAFEILKSYAYEKSNFTVSARLTDSLCQQDCKDVAITCCSSSTCCNKPTQTVCLAVKNIAAVCLDVKAVSTAVSSVFTYAKSIASAVSQTVASAGSAIEAATAAALAINVKRKSCCQVSVSVSAKAYAYGSAFSSAVSKTKAAAEAISKGTAQANALAKAVSKAKSSAEAISTAYDDNSSCCQNSCCTEVENYGEGDCCQQSSAISRSFAQTKSKSVETAVSQAATLSKSSEKSASYISNVFVERMKEIAGLQFSFSLSCCCCTTKPNVVNTDATKSGQNGGKSGDTLIPSFNANSNFRGFGY